MDLEQVKLLAQQDRYDEALAECEKWLREAPNRKADILRIRAYTLARQGDYERALQDRESIFQMEDGTIRDYYLAANNALMAGHLPKAASWLKEVVRRGKDQDETWFEAATRFLLAYVLMESGDLRGAKRDLDLAIAMDPDCAMPLPGLGVWNCNRLREEIERRAASG